MSTSFLPSGCSGRVSQVILVPDLAGYLPIYEHYTQPGERRGKSICSTASHIIF